MATERVSLDSSPAAYRLIDTHVHLDDPAFDHDRSAVIAASRRVGVTRFVNIGYCPERWETSGRLRREHPEFAVALGLHPSASDLWSSTLATRLREALRRHSAVAVGEAGLDYFRGGPAAPIQRRAFAAQIELALETGLPLIVHQRAAEDDLIAALEERPVLPRVILHSFEGSDRLGGLARDRKLLVGVGGLATRASARALRGVLASVPVEQIVLETDSPYLLPAGVKTRRNTPGNLPRAAELLAPIWSLTAAELARITTATAATLFGFPLDDPDRGGEASA